MSFFSNIISKITGWFSTAETAVEDAFTKAESVVNILKTFVGSVTGQTIIAIMEAFLPGAATTVINLLNEFFKDFGLVEAESTKPMEQIAADGFNAVSKLTGNSKIVALSNIASIIGHGFSSVNGGNSTLQEAIVALPIMHKPNLIDLKANPGIIDLPVGAKLPDGNIIVESAQYALNDIKSPNV